MVSEFEKYFEHLEFFKSGITHVIRTVFANSWIKSTLLV